MMLTETPDAVEQKSYIVATSQQTRFHLGVTRRSAEVHALSDLVLKFQTQPC